MPPAPSDQGKFDNDVWELFNIEEDRSESKDLAAQHPEKLKELQDLWMAEAKKNNVFPLIDVGVHLIHELEFHAAPPATGRYVFYPGTTEVPEATAPRTLGSQSKRSRKSSSQVTAKASSSHRVRALEAIRCSSKAAN